jgi:hypothetical protein
MRAQLSYTANGRWHQSDETFFETPTLTRCRDVLLIRGLDLPISLQEVDVNMCECIASPRRIALVRIQPHHEILNERSECAVLHGTTHVKGQLLHVRNIMDADKSGSCRQAKAQC